MLPHTLLVPTVRSTAQSPFPRPRSPRLKPTPTKLIRARSGSASLPQSEPSSFVPNSFTEESFGLPLNLVPDHESFQLEGYQMYAVEKWYSFASYTPYICSLSSQDRRPKTHRGALSLYR